MATLPSTTLVDRGLQAAVLLGALIAVAVGVIGLASPGWLTELRFAYVGSPTCFYGAVVLRLLTGAALLLVAKTSRHPLVLMVLGAVVTFQAVAASINGVGGSLTVLAWEGSHPGLMRLGALIAMACGGFVAFAVWPRTPSVDNIV